MNRKYFFLCFLLLAIFSCTENDYSSYCPTWKGFTYKTGNYPNYTQGTIGHIELHPGDSIHVTAHQDQRGRLINATDYTWTICYDTIDTETGDRVHATKSYYQHTNYDGYADGANDPTGHLELPANALPTTSKPDTIRFVARYLYSGQGVIVENGNIDYNSSYNGHITPRSGPTEGGAKGQFFFDVAD